MADAVAVTPEQARRIAVRAQVLDGTATGVLDTVRRLGFLQLDPIAHVARPQHLVLWSRLGAYDIAELDRLVWQERKLFEYDAFLYPVEDLPVQRARMMRRRRSKGLKWDQWVRDFLRENARFRRHVLAELERSGPLLSRDLEHELMPKGEGHRWWGDRQVRLMLDILAGRGEIAVAGRAGTQRLWDLPERVFPDSETLSWREAERVLAEQRRRTQGVWRRRDGWYAHPDVPDDHVPDRVTFLSPFDRLIHDRDRAEALWGFRYRLEMYVPKGKREYGYYVLPILQGDRLVGRMDAQNDRRAGVLRVDGVWWEAGVPNELPLDGALDELASWLGAERVERPGT